MGCYSELLVEFSNLDKESEEKGLRLFVLKDKTWLDADFKNVRRDRVKIIALKHCWSILWIQGILQIKATLYFFKMLKWEIILKYEHKQFYPQELFQNEVDIYDKREES